MDWLIMIIWGVVLPLPVKAGTEYILRQYYQYPQRLPGHRVYLHCLLSGIFIVFWSDGQGVSVLFLTLLFLCLVMLFHIDNAVFYLPDKLVFPVLWAGLLFQNEVQLVTISSALYGVIGGFFLLWFVAESYAWCRKKSGLGGGDIKLFSATGAWVGAEQLALLLMLACVSALVVYGLHYFRHRYNHLPPCSPGIIAFGPHLIAGMIMVMGLMSVSRFQ
ncbi:prepilin peptidase [Morganella morganii]|uniref:prepilin peptidase n=1 Tax=Morganella morganii TaxID=582 RepID=UPI0034E3AEDC